MAGHSSIIFLSLEVNGERFDMSHLGGGFFRLEDSGFISAGEAKINVTIDGKHDFTDIVINEDIPAGSRERNYYTTKKALERAAQDVPEIAGQGLAPA